MLADHVGFVKVNVLKELSSFLGGDLVKTEDIEPVLVKPLFTRKIKAFYLLFRLDQVFWEAVVIDHTGAVDLSKVLLYFKHVVMSGLWAFS